jgi:hypothetical protein
MPNGQGQVHGQMANGKLNGKWFQMALLKMPNANA